MSINKKIAILGDGSWGVTLSLLLHKKGFSVSLWGAFADYLASVKETRESIKFLPGFKIPEPIVITNVIEEALKDSTVVVVATPSQFLRSVVERFKADKLSSKIIVSVVKGIENKTFKRPSEIIREELGEADTAVLSGPTIAREVVKGLPTSAVVASNKKEIAKQVQEIFMSERFRIYTSSDVVGVELGGALKNIIAIAAGISDGLALGTNAKAALFTRGIVEMKRIGVAYGADPETFNGLSGIGDLVTTCISPYSRNRHVGEEIAKGKRLKDIVKSMDMVAEGVETARSVYELAKSRSIKIPITEQVYKVLFENKDALAAVGDLMNRSRKAE